MSETPALSLPRRLLRSLGPAIIVASVVLGPGSILTSSKVGCQFGYSMAWVIVAAGVMMVAMVALAARLGVLHERTLCEELAARLGRGTAVFVGVTMFLVIACFQSSNNIAVIAALEPMLADPASGSTPSLTTGMVPTIGLILLNVLVVLTMYGLRQLYVPLEKLMMILVGMMILGFAGNLFFAQPSISAALAGLIPSLPEGVGGGQFLPSRNAEGGIIDPWWAVQGLIATTFSIAGAFYQAYLVREKGWTEQKLSQGLVDSLAGISVLGGVTMMIMFTAAAVLHGRMDPEDLKSTNDVAMALAPLFGDSAKFLFSMGIFAGAFSSFLVNAMIGGALLADSLGMGGKMDQAGPKAFTVASLMVGMFVAIGTTSLGIDRVPLIVFAQALTVIGGPVLAFSLLYLALKVKHSIPTWLFALASVGTLATVLLAIRTGWRIYLQLT